MVRHPYLLLHNDIKCLPHNRPQQIKIKQWHWMPWMKHTTLQTPSWRPPRNHPKYPATSLDTTTTWKRRTAHQQTQLLQKELPLLAPRPAIRPTASCARMSWKPNAAYRLLFCSCCRSLSWAMSSAGWTCEERIHPIAMCGQSIKRWEQIIWHSWTRTPFLACSLGKRTDHIVGTQTTEAAYSIGSVHLVLSALPAKILKAVSAFGWQPNKKYGFVLLNECRQSKRVRSSMATIMLLAYYTAAISFAPQIMSDVYKKTAMDVSSSLVLWQFVLTSTNFFYNRSS